MDKFIKVYLMKFFCLFTALFLVIALTLVDPSTAFAATPIQPDVTSSLSNGSYTAGQVVPVLVTFPFIVVVSGTPQLTLSTGSPATTRVDYSSGSGTTTLIFNYTVAAGNASNDLDYASRNALILNGGAIMDANAKNITYRLAVPGATGSLAANKNIIIDTTPPSVMINQAASQPDPALTSPINFTVIFSEVTSGFATGDVSLTGTAGANAAVVTGSGTTYNVEVSGMTTNGTVIANIKAGVANDAAGNPNTTSTSSDNTVTYAATPMTVTINQDTSQPDPSNVSPINFTVLFSENTTDFATGDVSLIGTAGATTAIVTGSGATYNIKVSGMTANGTVIANIAAGVAHDITGSPNSNSVSIDNSVIFDTIPPTINIGAPSLSSTRSGPVTYTITYADTNFNKNTLVASNITLNKTGTANGTITSVQGSGLNCIVTISNITGNGTLGISVAAGTASDTAGNFAPAAGPGTTFSVDSIPPYVTWLAPVIDGQVYYVSNQSLQLSVLASDNVGVSLVVVKHWDYQNLKWIEIGRLSNTPYNFDFDTSLLLPQMNELRAFAYDAAGNYSISSIWLYHLPVLTVVRAGPGNGRVTSSPTAIDCGSICSYGFSYDPGAIPPIPATTVTLTATPIFPSTFAGWSGACSGMGTCILTMDAAKAVTAIFADPRLRNFIPLLIR